MREEQEEKKKKISAEKTGKSAGKGAKKTAEKELNSDEEVIDISSASEDYKESGTDNESGRVKAVVALTMRAVRKMMSNLADLNGDE